MKKRSRRNHGPGFKAKVSLAAVRGEKTLTELAQQFDVYAHQIRQWKDQLLKGASGVFGEIKAEAAQSLIDVKTLHAKIGALTPSRVRRPTSAQNKTVPVAIVSEFVDGDIYR